MRQPLHGIRGAVYDVLTRLVRTLGRPVVNGVGSGLGCWFLRLGPLTVAFSSYSLLNPCRPTSGDRQAIDESLWLFTRHHARGVGLVRPWAALMNIDIEISGQRFSSEDGHLELHPPLTPRGKSITIHNTGSAAEADVELVVYFDESEESDTIRVPCARLMIHGLKPGGRVLMPVEQCGTVGAIVYRMKNPRSPQQLARIYGRPEWES